MTDRLNRLVGLAASLLVLASLQSPALAKEPAAFAPSEYTAVYEVLRNGEKVANVTLDLSRQGDEWAYRGFTHDMRGLGKLLNVEGQQDVSGKWLDGGFQPDSFTFSFSLVGFRSRWRADFDWLGGTVTTGKKSRKATLPLTSTAMDPMSLMLNTGVMLATGRTEMTIDVIDGDEIENHRYTAHPGEFLDTGLGCLRAARVERIRQTDKRRSTAWYAEQLAYIPLQARHTKKKGSTLQASIVSLRVAGQEMPVSAACTVEAAAAAGN